MRPLRPLGDLKNYFSGMNKIILVCTFLLLLIGLVEIYSATYSNTINFFEKQIVWYVLGLVGMVVMANLNYNILLKMGNFLYWTLSGILLVVLIIGHSALGAQRWLKLGSFQFQPSEFMKIVLALAMVRYIIINSKNAFSFKNILIMILLMAFPLVLILFQPDLGTALLMIPMTLVIFYIGNISLKKMTGLIISGLLMMPLVFNFLKDYQRQRIDVFFNPNIDRLGAGYNVIQSQIAVGSGGLLGKGFLQGTQSQLNFIPIRHTDFIYAALAEEFGFWGSIILLIIYFVLIMEGLKIVKLCKSTGGKMLAGALTYMLLFQIFINIGMNIGIMPVTGLTLPLLSYGGSSVLVVMMALGILQNIYKEYMKAEG